jgi:hypothetical protein
LKMVELRGLLFMYYENAQTIGEVSANVVPSEMRLEFGWRILRSHEVIVSGGKVNWLIDGFCGESLPAIDLAHVDLP